MRYLIALLLVGCTTENPEFAESLKATDGGVLPSLDLSTAPDLRSPPDLGGYFECIDGKSCGAPCVASFGLECAEDWKPALPVCAKLKSACRTGADCCDYTPCSSFEYEGPICYHGSCLMPAFTSCQISSDCVSGSCGGAVVGYGHCQPLDPSVDPSNPPRCAL